MPGSFMVNIPCIMLPWKVFICFYWWDDWLDGWMDGWDALCCRERYLLFLLMRWLIGWMDGWLRCIMLLWKVIIVFIDEMVDWMDGWLRCIMLLWKVIIIFIDEMIDWLDGWMVEMHYAAVKGYYYCFYGWWDDWLRVGWLIG